LGKTRPVGTREAITTGTPFAIASLHGGEHWLVHVTPAEGLNYDSLDALINRCLYEPAIRPTIHCDDLDGRCRVCLEWNVLTPKRRPSEDDSILIDHPEQSEIAGLERFETFLTSTLACFATSGTVANRSSPDMAGTGAC